MKSYEKALEELKIKYEVQNAAIDELKLKARDFIEACKKLLQAQRNELKTSIKRLTAFTEGKTYQEYLEGLTDESNS